MNQHIVKTAVENKVFDNGTIDGYTVVAIDGTKFFGSNKKNCPENSIWINHCKSLGMDTIVRAKNNNNKSLRFAKKTVNKMEAVEVWECEKGFEKVEVYETIFTMDNVEQPLRFVKFAIKHKDKKRAQIMLVTTCMDMTFKTLFKIIRA